MMTETQTATYRIVSTSDGCEGYYVQSPDAERQNYCGSLGEAEEAAQRLTDGVDEESDYTFVAISWPF